MSHTQTKAPQIKRMPILRRPTAKDRIEAPEPNPNAVAIAFCVLFAQVDTLANPKGAIGSRETVP